MIRFCLTIAWIALIFYTGSELSAFSTEYSSYLESGTPRDLAAAHYHGLRVIFLLVSILGVSAMMLLNALDQLTRQLKIYLDGE